MSEPRALIDSNILVYAFDSSEKEKHFKAKKLLASCYKRERMFALSLQNLSEFFVIATNKIERPIEAGKAIRIVKNLSQFEGINILEPTKDTIIKAMELASKNKIDYWDLLIAAIMLQNDISDIYTENTKDFAHSGINPINPFVS